MAIGRRQRFYGQGRVDIPHIRAIESGIAYDVDVLMGAMLCGNKPLVLGGFDASTAGIPGLAATALTINVAGALVAHPLASDSGTILEVPSDRSAEILTTSNPRVVGSFTANAVNFIGIDLFLSADATTSDIIQFLDEDTNSETAQELPLAATFDYKIYISTQDFSTTPNLAPLIKVTTDVNNQVTAMVDVRSRMFRLGSGGTLASATNKYSWPGGRTEVGDNTDFTAGDKSIKSLKDWMDATMTRLWEVGGGEHWYSPTADRNVRVVSAGTTFSNGQYFEWDGTNLHWRGLKVLFDNSTGHVNTVSDQLANSAETALADGDAIYVDLDRTQNATVAAKKAALISLGSPTIPGARLILAWRSGTDIFARDSQLPVGTLFAAATTTALGAVKLSVASGTPSAPVVFNPNANGTLIAAATGGNAPGAQLTGNGTGAGVEATGGATGSAIVSHGVAGNDKPQLQVQNSAGKIRGAYDHIGFPLGARANHFREEWYKTFTHNTAGAVSETGGFWLLGVTGAVSAKAGAFATPPVGYPAPVLQLDNGGTATNDIYFVTNTQFVPVGPDISVALEFEAIFSAGALTNSDLWLGFNQTNAPSTDTFLALFRRTHGAGNHFFAVSAGGTGTGNTDTTVAPTAGTAMRFRIEMHGTATPYAGKARYFINDVLVVEHAAHWETGAVFLNWGLGFESLCALTAANQSIYIGAIEGVWNRWATPAGV